jgi:hypothetical protein
MINDDVLIIDWASAKPQPNWLTAQDPARRRFEIAQNVMSLSVDYSVNGCSQLSVEIADQDLMMYRNNYFQISTPVLFKGGDADPRGFGETFRISSMELSQSNDGFYTVRLECRTKAVQEMREDKTPQSYKSSTGFEFARKVAAKFKLIPYIEEIKGIKQSTIKVKGVNNKDSVWDVLLRSAQDINFLCFVSNGRLFYGSPQWLLGRWGFETVPGVKLETYQGKTQKRDLNFVPLLYPHEAFDGIDPESKRLLLLKAPTMRRSEDSVKESEGSAEIWGGPKYEIGEGSAYRLRAGMTVMPRLLINGVNVFRDTEGTNIGNDKGFDNAYLITSVKYQFGQPEPIAIAYATVDKLAPEEKRKMNEKINEITVISGTGK